MASTRGAYGWGQGERANAPGYFHGELLRNPTLLGTMNGSMTWIQVSFWHCNFAALSSDGEVYIWGSHGVDGSESVPTRVEALVGIKIVKMKCGWSHMLALSEDGKLFTWGTNRNAQLGRLDDFLSPKMVAAALKDEVVVDIAPCFAVTASGSVFSWGPHAITGDDFVFEPVMVRGFGTKHFVVSISASMFYHSACVTREGELFTWGYGTHGMLGHGNDEDHRHSPKLVEAFRGVRCKQVS